MKRERREFLADVGKGMLVATIGTSVAYELGIERLQAREGEDRLTFGSIEPLVDMMANTPVEKLQLAVVEKHRSGVGFRTLTAAAALANARAFGGQDYTGFHTFMALGPALQMAGELPSDQSLLPLLKVFYRNTDRIQTTGANEQEVLRRIQAARNSGQQPDGEMLRQATRDANFEHAEELFAVMSDAPPNEAYNHLQFAVQDEVDVHRTVLAWRAWMMLDVAGEQHAHTLLRQSVRYCVDSEQSRIKRNNAASGIRELLPKLFDEYGLESRTLGKGELSDQSLSDLTQVIFSEDRSRAATAVAIALADGVSPEAIGEALILAANRLLLHDPGRTASQASKDKPAGSVHGASVGVHAMDAANAWRNIARVCNHRNQVASLIVGAYHTAGQTKSTSANPLGFVAAADELRTVDAPLLLDELDSSIRDGNQVRACGCVFELNRKGTSPEAVFAAVLPFAVSEDGALHAEKFYRTVREEFVGTRPSLRWNHLIALARVSASEFGNPAPGQNEARELLGLS
ncbi:MAG: hypothetical protein SGI77_16125 [Pirellulaceae bacterium]|nr:hypothetical protein [Pirellulaceae bacterium]